MAANATPYAPVIPSVGFAEICLEVQSGRQALPLAQDFPKNTYSPVLSLLNGEIHHEIGSVTAAPGPIFLKVDYLS